MDGLILQSLVQCTPRQAGRDDRGGDAADVLEKGVHFFNRGGTQARLRGNKVVHAVKSVVIVGGLQPGIALKTLEPSACSIEMTIMYLYLSRLKTHTYTKKKKSCRCDWIERVVHIECTNVRMYMHYEN